MRKKLLSEAQVRRFQSLASIEPLNEMESYNRDDEDKMEEMSYKKDDEAHMKLVRSAIAKLSALPNSLSPKEVSFLATIVKDIETG